MDETRPAPPARVRVWDLPLRLFHWGLVAAFAVAWYTQEEAYEPHRVAGYAVLGLLAFRLLWGFAGSRHARFRSFCYGPGAVLRYLRGLRAGQPPNYLGHNPAGSVMIWLLLLGLLVVCASGVALDGAENFAGPLQELRLFRWTGPIEEIHELASDAVTALVALHLLGVVVSSWLHGENLLLAMLTGRKRADPAAEDQP
ncbi:MAG TPA: cytochrome b/b6 domain-containing protein [Gammaproteobacteria bacterium]